MVRLIKENRFSLEQGGSEGLAEMVTLILLPWAPGCGSGGPLGVGAEAFQEFPGTALRSASSVLQEPVAAAGGGGWRGTDLGRESRGERG